MTYEALQKSINQKQFKPIYLLHGQENYFIDKITEQLENNILSETDKAFNQVVLYGKDVDAAQLVSTAQQFPMMAPYQVVILKEAQQMKQLESILHYCENPSQQTVLVIAHKGKTINARSKLVKAIDKNGIIFNSKSLYENQVPKWINDLIKQKGYNAETEVANILAENIGTDLSRIEKEVEKIILNIGDQKVISIKHIEQHSGIMREFNVFELSKSLSEKNWKKSIKIANYFAHNPKAAPLPLLMGSLYNNFSKLLVIRSLSKLSDTDIMKASDINNNYIFKITKQSALKFKTTELENILALLLEYDLKSKGVEQADNNTGEIVKELVCRISMAQAHILN